MWVSWANTPNRVPKKVTNPHTCTMALAEIDECGVLEIDSAKQFFNFVITQDNMLDAMTMAMKQAGKK